MLDLVFAKFKRQCGKQPVCHGVKDEGGRRVEGKVCTFHECMLKDNHKNTAHTGNGK